jgi:indolepyruvate ferredoxin oxidoreductase, beta subunit
MDTIKPATNVVLAGLGGQGVIKASDILADAALRMGWDVKKSELHGMSQRGGSVTSDVRFGDRVLSPMVPAGEADFLVLLTGDQLEPNRQYLKPSTVVLAPSAIHTELLLNPKSLNIALLGLLSQHLKISREQWLAAIRAHMPEKLLEINMRAFELGCATAAS